MTCNEKWILYNQLWPTQWLDWEAAPKHFPTPNLHQNHWLVVCCQSNLLQLCESPWNHYLWEVYSVNRWDAPKITMPAVGICQQKGPNSSSCYTRPNIPKQALQKMNELDYEVLPHQPYSPDFSPTDYQFFKRLDNFFCRKNASTILESRMQKVLSKSSLNLKLNFLCYRNKQIYFSLAKMCWL